MSTMQTDKEKCPDSIYEMFGIDKNREDEICKQVTAALAYSTVMPMGFAAYGLQYLQDRFEGNELMVACYFFGGIVAKRIMSVMEERKQTREIDSDSLRGYV